MTQAAIKQRLLRGGAWALSAKVVAAFAGLILSSLLARLLSPSELGAYFLTFSIVSIGALLAQLGMNQVVVRMVAEVLAKADSSKVKPVLRMVFVFFVMGTLVVTSGLTLFGEDIFAGKAFKSSNMAGVMSLVACWVVALACQNLLAEIFRGFQDFRFASIFGGLVSSVISAALFAGLWVWQGYSSLEQVILLSIGSGMTSVFMASILIGKKVAPLGWGEAVRAIELWRMGWPIFLTNVAFLMLQQADIWILGAFCSEHDVAVYGAAARLALIISLPLLIANSVVAPFVAASNAKVKLHDIESTVRTFASLAFIPAAFGMGLIAFWSSELMSFVYGDIYREGSSLLVLLSVVNLVKVYGGSCGIVLLMTGHQWALLKITSLSGLLTIALSIISVQEYGGEGIAFSLIVGFAIQNISTVFYIKKTFGFWTHVSFKFIYEMPGRLWALLNNAVTK